MKKDIREIVFGAEDGLVSTLGAVTGIAAGSGSSYIVILSGLVLIVVESLSMGAGSFLSSKAVYEVQVQGSSQTTRTEQSESMPIRAGIVMFFSYAIAGVIPLAPYFFFSVKIALAPSVIATILALFALGSWKARYTKRSKLKSGFEMVIVSMAAAVLGFVVGKLVAGMAGG